MQGAVDTRGGWRAEYRRSLTSIEAEELLDVVLYRPLAFLLNKRLAPTALTPNQLSVASLGCAVVAAVLLWTGDYAAWTLAALAYFVCNTLDCADGQLARLRGNGSPIGYLVDGTVDHFATIAICIGMAHGLAVTRPEGAIWWGLTTAAGVSYAWQCAILDRLRKEWHHRVHGRPHDAEEEADLYRRHLAELRQAGGHRLLRGLIVGYLGYHVLWRGVAPSRRAGATTPLQSAAWAAAHRPVLRLATWMGPTTQMTIIMVCAAAGRLELFVWGNLVLGNAYAAGVLLLQRRASGRGVE